MKRLVIHAGTPKTGTSALQDYFAGNAGELLRQGVYYPPPTPGTTKHQILVRLLVNGDLAGLARYLDEVAAATPATAHTIVLSTEGIYNHWRDFPRQAREGLGALLARFQPVLWVWFREPVAYMLSLYQQCLQNPPVANTPYGLDIGFAEFLELPWAQGHLDYPGFIEDWRRLCPGLDLLAMPYEGDTVALAMRLLGLPYSARAGDGRATNKSLSQEGIDIIRAINRRPLPPAERAEAIAMARKLDALAFREAPGPRPDACSAAAIEQLMNRYDFPSLSRRHGLAWTARA